MEHSPSPLPWLLDVYAQQPLLVVLLGLVLLALGLVLIRKAMKIAVVLVILAAILLGGSWFFQGEDATLEDMESFGRTAGESILPD